MKNKILEIKPLGFPWETKDPFLFCVHHRDEYPRGNEQMGIDFDDLRGRNIGQDFTTKDGWRMYHGSTVPGFPVHPHRGFETITINKEGVVDHSDSLGAAGRFREGDVQWMTAGKGCQHAEMFPLLNQDTHNHLEIFQIWLNLPKASKFVEPHYRMLWQENIPVVTVKDENNRASVINIIAGNVNGTQAAKPTPDSWAANPDNLVQILTTKMNAHAKWTMPAVAGEANRSLYFYKGASLNIEDKTIKEYHLAHLNANEDIVLENGNEDAYLLILQGRPINEPVAHHGPFVMNTQEEIQQTMRDYQETQFGGWPWPEREQVHGKERGRFALHADGTEENK